MESKYLNGFYNEENRKRLATFFFKNKEYTTDSVTDHFIRMGFEQIIRDYTDYITPLASPEAKKIAKDNNISLDKHRKATPKIKEGTLKFEHDPPLSQIIDRCLKAESKEAIEGILKEVKVTWITEEQNKALNDKGWNSERPSDAYAQLGILPEKA